MANKYKRKRKNLSPNKTCTSKRRYLDSDEAAHTAGIEALRRNVKLKIYKCPYGDHWHLAKWRPK